MVIFIQIFALSTVFFGLVILFNPEIVFGLLRKNADQLSLHIIAVVIRLALGICLIEQAEISIYPLVIEVLGWLSIVAALTFGVIGRKRYKQLMHWALSDSLITRFGRFGGLLAAGFGAFLVYAFI